MSTCFVKFIRNHQQIFFVRLNLIGLALVMLLAVTGCRNPIDTTALNSLAKTDVDKMADTSLQEMNLSLIHI
mgnify:FL=1